MLRRNNIRWLFALTLVAIASRASAQTFPSTDKWRPLPCGSGVMVDRRLDTPNAVDELDLVGNDDTPAGYHASDATFLYLRLRLDGNPSGTNNRLKTHGWGFEIDLDGVRSTYELLIAVDGLGTTDEVAIWRNSAPPTLPNDPADPADQPPLFTYPFTTHGRSVPADTSQGGNPDFFLDLAVPWSDLATLNVRPNTPASVWAGSSTVANALDLDLACRDGAGGRLDGIDVNRTVLDPFVDTDGDGIPDATEITAGTNPNDPKSKPAAGGPGPRTLEGGPGCALGGRASTSTSMLLGFLLVLSWLARRRRSPTA